MVLTVGDDVWGAVFKVQCAFPNMEGVVWKCWLVYSQPFHYLLFSPFFVFRGIANDFYLHAHLDSFLDRQHASTCSCLVIVVFVQKVFSHLANERLFFPSKFVLPLRLSRFSRPLKNDDCSKLQVFNTTRRALSRHHPQDVLTTCDAHV